MILRIGRLFGVYELLTGAAGVLFLLYSILAGSVGRPLFAIFVGITSCLFMYAGLRLIGLREDGLSASLFCQLLATPYIEVFQFKLYYNNLLSVLVSFSVADYMVGFDLVAAAGVVFLFVLRERMGRSGLSVCGDG